MPGEDIDSVAQSAVVLELLERPNGWALAHLHATIRDVAPPRLMAAAESLQDAGVIRRDGDRLYPTLALERLDALGMVSI